MDLARGTVSDLNRRVRLTLMKLELPTSGTAGLQFIENIVADRTRVSKGLESALESAGAGV